MPHPKLVEYTNLLSHIPTPNKSPIFQSSGKLLICLIEFRELHEIQWVMNAIVKVYPKCDVGAAIVYGTENADFVENIFANHSNPWKNLKLIKTEHKNLNRGTYSALLKTPQFYEHFSDFSHVLIYQTDALLFQQIKDVYFEYDYIGAPWILSNQCAPICAGNGGFSLRNVKSMIRVCESNRHLNFHSIHRGNEDIFFCSQKSLVYPKVNTDEHKQFAMERVYHPEPIGSHQLYLCIFNHEQWCSIKTYFRNKLFDDPNLIISNDFVPNSPNLIFNSNPHAKQHPTQNIPLNIKKKMETKKEYLLSSPPNSLVKNEYLLSSQNSNNSSVSDTSLIPISEILNESVTVGPFTLKLIHVSKNQWQISCSQNYEVLLCKTQHHDSAVVKSLIDSHEISTIHKKQTGVFCYQESIDSVCLVFSGFPNGGGCWADICISDGQKFAKGLPRNGSIILKSTLKSIEKIVPIYSQKNSLAYSIQPELLEDKHKLIFHLYSGVGFYNQLFSFELALYFASLSKRHLILYIAHPLVHAGRADREHGILLDYLDKNKYSKFLPNGMTVLTYDSKHLEKWSRDSFTIQIENNTSNTVFCDDDLNTRENRKDILNFSNNRLVVPFSKLDPLFDSSKKIVTFKKTNAARINTGFYTHSQNYSLMSNIMKSVSSFCPVIQDSSIEIFKNMNLKPDEIIAIHLRFGDIYRKSSQHGVEHETVAKNIVDWALDKFPDKNKTFLIMCDRKDYPIVFDAIRNAGFKLIFSDDLIPETTKHSLRTFQNSSVAEFCIQKLLCEQSKWFLANYGSTVSVSIAYNMFSQGKDWELFSNAPCSSFNRKTLKLNRNMNEKYSWKQRGASQSHVTSWAYFSPDNLKI
jgi:hypothetical protein